jgi:molecular chaperone DnaK
VTRRGSRARKADAVRLGVDFGTTHTVAALVDRGNYPTVGFEWGDALPSLLAVRGTDGAVRFGRDAEEVAGEPSWSLVRSFKRLLRDAGPLTELRIGSATFRVADLLAGYFSKLREELLTASNAGLAADEPIHAAVSVPANASNDQRFLTLDAFRRAGFEVLTLLNEPSAAGFEYGHRFRRSVTSRREYVLVYDLGGGTFDASLIHMAGLVNEVITSAGVPRLGGDDFDEAIFDLVCRAAGLGELESPARNALVDVCREQKEGASPNTRRFVFDLAAADRDALVVPADEVYAACEPLVEKTIGLLDGVLRDPRRQGRVDVEVKELAGIYVVGGASSFPPVARRLREQFGQARVKRSPHPYAATAIGLACFLDEDAGYSLSDCLTRHFGVWRESAAGREVCFDPIFLRDTRLPGPFDAPLEVVRRYAPAHNLGHFRYVECGTLRDGRPDGNVTPWDGIWFPFDPALRDREDLAALPVSRVEGVGPEIEERYRCTPSGTFEVTLTCLEDGYTRDYMIARRGGR